VTDEFVDPFAEPDRRTDDEIIDQAAKDGEYDLPAPERPSPMKAGEGNRYAAHDSPTPAESEASATDSTNPDPEEPLDPFQAYKTPPLKKKWTAADLGPPGEPEVGELRLEAVETYPGLFRLGLDGEPFVGEGFLPYTAEEKLAVLAWASGVWFKQAIAESQRRARSLSEVEAKLGRKIPEQTPEARLERAVAYARWRREAYERGEVGSP
jgi:hypothetical protein